MANVTINTIQDLVAFSNGDYGRGSSSEYLNVVLTTDLDFNDLREYDSAYDWAGCTGTWYVNFNGQGHKIDNIYYMGTGWWGFFGTIYGSIQHLKLTNMYVTSTGGAVGGIASDSRDAVIKNCHISGHLESTYAGVGGIAINENAPVTVRESSVSGVLKSATNGWAAGLVVGTNTNKKCYSCLVVADIKGNYAYPWNNSGGICNNCEYRGILNGTSGSGWVYNYQSSVYNSIMVVMSGSSNFRNSSVPVNSYYDSDLASAAGVVCTGTGATTEQLHDRSWIRSKGLAI